MIPDTLVRKYQSAAENISRRCSGDVEKLKVSVRQLYLAGIKEVNKDAPSRRDKVLNSMFLLETILNSVFPEAASVAVPA